MYSKSALIVFGILLLGSGVAWAMVPAENIYAIDLPRWIGNATASADVIEGGNVTYLNVSGASLTDKWADYFGNITSSLTLRAYNDTSDIFHWSWNIGGNGVVCATPNGSFDFGSITNTSGTEIDSAWGFTGADSDSGVKTFGGSCNVSLATANVTGTQMADTLPSGEYRTCAVKSVAGTPNKNQVAFCTVMGSYNNYRGDPVSYEMMVPTPAAPGAAGWESYYFFIEVQ